MRTAVTREPITTQVRSAAKIGAAALPWPQRHGRVTSQTPHRVCQAQVHQLVGQGVGNPRRAAWRP